MRLIDTSGTFGQTQSLHCTHDFVRALLKDANFVHLSLICLLFIFFILTSIDPIPTVFTGVFTPYFNHVVTLTDLGENFP